MPNDLFFCNNVRDRRKEKKLSQHQMADLLHVSLKTYQNWENRHATPDIEGLYNVCEILDCDIDFLFGKQSCARKEIATIHDITGLSEDAINQLKHLKQDGLALSPLVSALIESSYFRKMIHEIYLAIWCKKPVYARMIKNPDAQAIINNPEIQLDMGSILRQTMIVSDDFTIVPREYQSKSYLQEAQAHLRNAAEEAIEKVETSHDLDDMMQHQATFYFYDAIHSPRGEDNG